MSNACFQLVIDRYKGHSEADRTLYWCMETNLIEDRHHPNEQHYIKQSRQRSCYEEMIMSSFKGHFK